MGQNIIYKCEKCGEEMTSLSVFRIHNCEEQIIKNDENNDKQKNKRGDKRARN